MKKFYYLLAGFAMVLVIVVACEGSDTGCDDNCGEVTSKGADPAQPWVVLKNECSGNSEKYVIDDSKWLGLRVGDTFCATNVDSWKPVK